jgi:hypothetical protein
MTDAPTVSVVGHFCTNRRDQGMKKPAALRQDLGLTPGEFAVLKRLSTPEKIQDFLCAMPSNFEIGGDTCLSVREVLKQRRAHCIEGAMLAACALWVHGEPPLLLDLQAVNDFDHVITVFKRRGYWGAISKTNPAFLRWRDPVYRTLRELAMSYLHEYANKRGHKTLRSYSRPFDMRRVAPDMWVTNGENCWEIGEMLDDIPHYPLLPARQARFLRRREAFERHIGTVLEHRAPPKRKAATKKKAPA